MQDQISSHTSQPRPAHKAWLGGLLLIMFWMFSGTSSSEGGVAAAVTVTSLGVMPSTNDVCTCSPDIYETDDTLAEATLLPLREPPQRHTFHAPPDVDWFRIEGLVSNRRYNVATANLADGADTYMILYDRDNNIIKTNDDFDTARCLTEPQFCASTITWTATSAGPYFVIVRTLSYPPQEFPSCPCPAYNIRLQSLTLYSPVAISPPSEPPTPTPTPTVTPTATPTRPVEVPTEVPLPQGRYPNGIAVNPDTHRVYVTSRDNDRLVVIDGLTNAAINSAKVGDQPWGVAVNRYTNKVYVGNFASGNLFVLDGTTLAVLETLWVGPQPTFIEINENTNTIFTITYGNEGLVVIDGNTDEVVKIIGTDSRGSWGLAVNPNLNRVYVSGRNSGTISTLDGNNHWQPIVEQAITPGGDRPCTPYELAFNPARDALYAACAQGSVDTALVYDTTARGLIPLARLRIGAGGADGGGGVAINTTTGSVFFTNSLENTVSVISGATNTVIATVPVGNNPFGIGVDTVTGRVFVGNRGSNTVSVFHDPLAP